MPRSSRALEDAYDVGPGQGAEDVDPAAREERGIDLEGRVLRGGADQGERALLDMRQEGVLLAPVEAMDLVDEEDGPAAAPRALGLRFGHHLADLLDAGQDGREGNEAGAGDLGHQKGQRGLAGAWRSPEDH